MCGCRWERAGIYSGGGEGSSLYLTKAMLLVSESPPVSSVTLWRRNGVVAAPCICFGAGARGKD